MRNSYTVMFGGVPHTLYLVKPYTGGKGEETHHDTAAYMKRQESLGQRLPFASKTVSDLQALRQKSTRPYDIR